MRKRCHGSRLVFQTVVLGALLSTLLCSAEECQENDEDGEERMEGEIPYVVQIFCSLFFLCDLRMNTSSTTTVTNTTTSMTTTTPLFTTTTTTTITVTTNESSAADTDEEKECIDAFKYDCQSLDKGMEYALAKNAVLLVEQGRKKYSAPVAAFICGLWLGSTALGWAVAVFKWQKYNRRCRCLTELYKQIPTSYRNPYSVMALGVVPMSIILCLLLVLYSEAKGLMSLLDYELAGQTIARTGVNIAKQLRNLDKHITTVEFALTGIVPINFEFNFQNPTKADLNILDLKAVFFSGVIDVELSRIVRIPPLTKGCIPVKARIRPQRATIGLYQNARVRAKGTKTQILPMLYDLTAEIDSTEYRISGEAVIPFYMEIYEDTNFRDHERIHRAVIAGIHDWSDTREEAIIDLDSLMIDAPIISMIKVIVICILIIASLICITCGFCCGRSLKRRRKGKKKDCRPPPTSPMASPAGGGWCETTMTYKEGEEMQIERRPSQPNSLLVNRNWSESQNSALRTRNDRSAGAVPMERLPSKPTNLSPLSLLSKPQVLGQPASQPDSPSTGSAVLLATPAGLPRTDHTHASNHGHEPQPTRCPNPENSMSLQQMRAPANGPENSWAIQSHEPRFQQIPVSADARLQHTPISADPRHQQMLAPTDPRLQHGPASADPRLQQSPPSSRSPHQQGTSPGLKQVPVSTDIRFHQMPALADPRFQQIPPITDLRLQQNFAPPDPRLQQMPDPRLQPVHISADPRFQQMPFPVAQLSVSEDAYRKQFLASADPRLQQAPVANTCPPQQVPASADLRFQQTPVSADPRVQQMPPSADPRLDQIPAPADPRLSHRLQQAHGSNSWSPQQMKFLHPQQQVPRNEHHQIQDATRLEQVRLQLDHGRDTSKETPLSRQSSPFK